MPKRLTIHLNSVYSGIIKLSELISKENYKAIYRKYAVKTIPQVAEFTGGFLHRRLNLQTTGGVNMDYLKIVTTSITYIEENLFEEDLVNTVYKVVHVSKFHFHRMFHLVTKHTLGQYIKKRRFTEIAKFLIHSEQSLIHLALHAGYNSHEAFTRAFKDYFGVTPSVYKKNPVRQTFLLLESYSKDVIEFSYTQIIEPEIIKQDEITLYGLSGQVMLEAISIDRLWSRFRQETSEARTGSGYTVWLDSSLTVQDLKQDRAYDCFVGVTLERNLEKLNIPSGLYAKFTIRGDFSKVRFVYSYIYFEWFKKSEYEFDNDMILEYYDAEFDYESQRGSLSILVPIKKKTEDEQ